MCMTVHNVLDQCGGLFRQLSSLNIQYCEPIDTTDNYNIVLDVDVVNVVSYVYVLPFYVIQTLSCLFLLIRCLLSTLHKLFHFSIPQMVHARYDDVLLEEPEHVTFFCLRDEGEMLGED